MHIEFFVEESSAEAALNNLAPAILGPDVTFQVHPYNGKPDLLAKLPDRLRGYRPWLPAVWRIVVLLDADEADCRQLKARLETIARAAGLTTRSAAGGAQFQVLNRLAVQELEAWFFGDVEALCAAYPRLDPNLAKRSRYRNPDAIAGGAWEALERELQRVGCAPGGLAKVATARAVSARMQPERNRSHSFQVFRHGLLELIR
jgi:hypothetical protein